MNATRQPKVGLLVLGPLPGDRGKSSHLLMVSWPWRSKWRHVQCAGQAKACKAGTCRHVRYVCGTYARCRPVPFDPEPSREHLGQPVNPNDRDYALGLPFTPADPADIPF